MKTLIIALLVILAAVIMLLAGFGLSAFLDMLGGWTELVTVPLWNLILLGLIGGILGALFVMYIYWTSRR